MWLEPEGLGTDVVYPNGISNSMEPEDQLRLLATIPGGWSLGGSRWVVPLGSASKAAVHQLCPARWLPAWSERLRGGLDIYARPTATPVHAGLEQSRMLVPAYAVEYDCECGLEGAGWAVWVAGALSSIAAGSCEWDLWAG